MFCCAVIGLALLAVPRLPLDMFGGLNLPAVNIAADWPGANPEEVERSITEPLEQAISTVNGIVRIQSTSSAENAQIQVWFDWNSDLGAALVQVVAAVQRAQKTLPAGLEPPSVSLFDTANTPIVRLSACAPGMDPRRLSELVQYTILPQILRVPGVSAAGTSGTLIRQINVDCDPQRLEARGLSLRDVQSALRSQNRLVPGGSLLNAHVHYPIQVPTMLQDVGAIEGVVVATRDQTEIKVSDVARVEDGHAPPVSFYTLDGRPGVGIHVYRQPQANMVQVSDAMRAVLPRLRGLPPEVRLTVDYDQSNYVRIALRSLVEEGLLGAFMVAVVVLVFLRDLRSVAIICLSLPLSVAAALTLLYFFHQSLNIFTLGGLTLALGRLVDDAIVVRENITRHLEKRKVNRVTAVLGATREVGMPVLASTLTTVAVFLPVVFMDGLSQRLFEPLALTIVFAMLASYLVSMTLDPVLSILWGSRTLERTPQAWALVLENGYEHSLRVALRHGKLCACLLLGLAAASLGLARTMPTEFLPDTDESLVTVTMLSQPGTSLEASGQLGVQASEVCRQALASNELRVLILSAGAPSNQARLLLRLQPVRQRHRSARQIASAVRSCLAERFPGVRILVSSSGVMKAILNYGAPAPISVHILGFDQPVALGCAARLAQELEGVRGLTNLQVVPQGQVPSFRVEIDRRRASMLKVTPVQVAETLNAAYGGSDVQDRFLDPLTGHQFKLVTQLGARYRTQPEGLGAVPLGVLFSHLPQMRSSALREPGSPFTLRDLARVELSLTPAQIKRLDQVRVVEVNAECTEPLGPTLARVQEALKDFRTPDGLQLAVSGQGEQQKSAFAAMTLASGLAVALVYMILATQFGNLWEPLVVMASVPPGLIGVVLIHKLTDTPFSVMSFLGLIMMIGIVVSNAILIVEFSKTLRARGLELLEAVVTASCTRLRPILMTAVATLVGMVPMATSLGGGLDTNLPLARAVIGGLGFSTLVSLYIVPQLYLALGGIRLRVDRRTRHHTEHFHGN